MLDSNAVKKLAIECGADLVGIAPVERFASAPPEADPKRIQPDARSVIVMGFRIPRGALRGVEEGTAWQTLAGMNPTGGICVDATYQFCQQIESAGWETVPLLTHSRDLRNQGVRVHPDKPAPNVILDMDFAANAAGLGEIGRGQFFLTPEFGPRQIFTAVITDLELTGDTVLSGAICDDCDACVDACPARAIDPAGGWNAPLAEGEVHCHGLHKESCRICKTGTIGMPYTGQNDPCRVGAACGRACVAHLEDAGHLSRQFHSKFRESQTQ